MRRAFVVSLVGVFSAALGDPVAAQSNAVSKALCDDPAAYCRQSLDDACLRVGAGVLAVDDTAPVNCTAQLSQYSACLAEATACDTAASPAPQEARCSPFVEQELYQAALRDAARRTAFEAACPASPLLALIPKAPASGAARSTAEPNDPETSDPETSNGAVETATFRVRSGQTVQICGHAASGAVRVSLRIWKRSATRPDDKATLRASTLGDEIPLAVGERVALSDDCALALTKTSYRGSFFAEIEVSTTRRVN